MVPSGRTVNHSGCAATHGWSGAHCSAKSSASSMPRSSTRRRKASKSSMVPSSGLDRVVAAVGRADRPRRADAAGRGDRVAAGERRAVGALAVRGADRVDRRQVDHVEAHRRDPVQVLGRGVERPVDGPAGLVAAAGGAREELVPGAVEGALAVHVDLPRLAAGDQLPDRPLGHDLLDRREQGRGDPGVQRQRRIPQRVGRAEQQVALVALGRPAAHPLQQSGADLQVVGQLLGATGRPSA